jgi:hypothetical protein
MHKMTTEFTGQWSSGRNKRQCGFLCKAMPPLALSEGEPTCKSRRSMTAYQHEADMMPAIVGSLVLTHKRHRLQLNQT